MNNQDKEDSLTLGILETIDERNDVTQRHLADRLGVALGLANSYLKRCVRKGLIKIKQAPPNRYLYYLTPKGFAEKSRLTAQYLAISFELYRKASNSYAELFRECRRRGWTRIVLCGVSDLAEIASLRAHEFGIEIVGVFDPKSEFAEFLKLPVNRTLMDMPAYDACILSTLDDPTGLYEKTAELAGREKVLVPAILGFSPAGSVKAQQSSQ